MLVFFFGNKVMHDINNNTDFSLQLKMKKGGGSTSTTPTMHSVIAYQTGLFIH